MSPTDAGDMSVIVTTFDHPKELETVLAALAEQEGETFEVIVADDGSGDEITRVVERWRARLEIAHVWQPDAGFRKARVLDLAALRARGRYLVFLDGDCVPRRGFMQALRRATLPGWFLSTKRLNLSERFSRRILDDKLPIWRWSAAEWLIRAPHEVERPGYLVPARDRRRPWRRGQPEFVPPAAAYCMVALPREDFERVNGYDARCVRWIDGEDQDLAIRLRRSGLRCGWPGPASTVLHLWHPSRPFRTSSRVPIFRETQESSHVEAVVGLRELASQ
jgi:glycosyltransferase involved in cell wall biosynthesis